MKNFLKNKVLVFSTAVLIAFFPQTINMERETDTRAIVVAIGIDKVDDEYEMSSQIIVPKFDVEFNENIYILTAKGDTLVDAYEKWIIHLGKEMGVSHTGALVISDSVATTEDVNKILDIFIRGDNMYSNSVVINTTGTAKDLLTYSAQKDNNLALSLENILKQNEKYSSITNKTLQEFYIDYYRQAGVSVMATVDVVKDDYLGLSIEEEEGTPKAEEGETKNVISNNGESAVFKDGIKVRALTDDETKSLGWLDKDASKTMINITGVTDNLYDDAEISLDVLKKKVKTKYRFKNGVPQVDTKIYAFVKLQSIRQDDLGLDLFTVTKANLTDGLRAALVNQIRSEVASIVNVCKNENLDMIGVYNGFYRFKNKEWKDYLDTLEDPDNYMATIDFFADVEVAIAC